MLKGKQRTAVERNWKKTAVPSLSTGGRQIKTHGGEWG